jgi:uncharacterized membrane protein
MESRAKIFGHPLHQQLIPFPLGLLGTAVLFDLIDAFGGSDALGQAAHYMIAAGILSGLVAAIPGTIDWAAIPDGTRAKRVATLHGAGNLTIVVAFVIAWFARRDNADEPSTVIPVLEIAAVLGAVVTGWLGGELVDRLAVGVDRGAHLDAPSSLTGRSARELAVK